MASKVKETKVQGTNVQNAQIAQIEGLENAEQVATPNMAQNFANREWLENNSPDFRLYKEHTTPKYDPEREPAVQNGINTIREMVPTINPLVLLLGKWWEVKPARAQIKAMIDLEAQSKNQLPDVYLQIELRKQVEQLAEIQTAVDRLKYSINYFKPRAGVGTQEVYKQLNLQGLGWYNVPLSKITEAREQFGQGTDAETKQKIREYILPFSIKLDDAEEL